MGEWLRDTVEAADLMASTMERARAAPKVVTAELHAMMLGLADHTKELKDKVSKFKGAWKSPAPGEALARTSDGGFHEFVESVKKASIPPSCNTGGKVPEQGKGQQGSKRSSVIGKPPFPPAKVQAYADTNGMRPKASK